MRFNGPVVKPGITRPWLFIPNWVRLREIAGKLLANRKFKSRPVHHFNMIKAIFFDVGGVIIDTSALMDNLVEVFNPIDKENFLHLLNKNLKPLWLNKIPDEAFWHNLAMDLKIEPKYAPKDFWLINSKKLLSVNNDVMQIVKELKQNYKLGIISNSLASQAALNNSLGIYNYFEAVLLSHELGLAKDSKEIFALAAKRLDVRPGESLLIDDSKPCIDTAKSAGFEGILFKNAAELRQELEMMK